MASFRSLLAITRVPVTIDACEWNMCDNHWLADEPRIGIIRYRYSLHPCASLIVDFSGPGLFRRNNSGYALDVLTPKASPLGCVFSQAQHPMIKTYNQTPY